ncbi:MAG: VWA domain-containing protein [Alphaproteobacteria bacterium]|uniref:VWA domain-containing protein n=1 Tax=Candidatus Nitrobium versatile TaxID=2884831 RepID=A0A953J3R9_9BACT|nr:VWA domain-containing protein [Candidatus Nitrobium versatile]
MQTRRTDTLSSLFLALWCAISLLLAAGVVSAEKRTPHDVVKTSPPPQKSGPDRGFDIVLLMDSSGSMKKSDPHNYRKDAARLFISLLDNEDRIGIVSFGDTAKTLIPLAQNTKENRGKLFSAVNAVSSKEFSTHIHDAVKKGYEELASSGRKNRILILLSDGKLTLGAKEKEDAAFAELAKLLPELAKAQVKLYSVAFTDQADARLLEKLAKETGGFFRFAKTDRDVHVMFASLFEKVKSPDALPLEGEEFSVDKEVREAVLLITRKPGTSTILFDPSRRKNTPVHYAENIQWYEAKTFDMITVRTPAPGRWRVKLSSTEGNRVFVVTDLSLKSSFTRSFVNKGETVHLDAWLEKGNSIIAEKDFLEKVSFFTDVTGPDRKSAKMGLAEASSPPNGKYSGALAVGATGEYEVRIVAEGKTFKREKLVAFKAAEPPAGPPAEQKKNPEAAPKKKQEPAGEASWKQVLVKFGIINASLAAVISLAYLVRWGMIKTKAGKGRGKKRDDTQD